MAFDGSYPAPPGNKRWSVVDVPLSGTYTAVTPGTPPTGGIPIAASIFGLQSIEACFPAGGTDDATYSVNTYMSPFNLNQPSPAVIAQLIIISTGLELATGQSLTGRRIRLVAMGAY